MKKTQMKLLVIFLLGINTISWSKKINPLIAYMALDSLSVDSTVARGSDLLSASSYPFTDTTWKNNYCYNNSKGTLVLRLKNNIMECIPNITSFQLNVRISYLTFTNQIITFDTVLNVNYNNAKGAIYKERAIYIKQNVHYLKATVLPFSNATYKKYFCLEAIIEEDRTYCGFNPNTSPAIISNTYVSASDEIVVSFNEDFAQKCDLIELEYQFVDAYNSNGLNSFLPMANISFDFRHNATRIAIKSNTIRISNIYEDGFIIIRARGVVFVNQNIVILGNWSVVNNGNLGALNASFPINIIKIGQGGSIPIKENKINWQYQAEFAEDAKKKEVMTFFDGLLKNRQTVTRSNTENTAIVAENIYDHIGRPSISTLPAPSFENKIRFYKKFNIGPWSQSYFPQNFELVTETDSCKKSGGDDPMSNSSGASKYYSSNNPILSGTVNLKNHQASYIPNANGYPFSHTEYTPDQTSRIRRQSGVGTDLKMGSGHETQYFYSVPEQMELDKLFGTEVGFNKHYKKNMVIDPNGQISVSYLDAKGRVIATNLAGTNSTNLKPLPNNKGLLDTIESDLTDATDTLFEDGALIINKTFNIAENNSKYELKYSLLPQSYIPACNANQICYDCIYNLNITLVDNECGAVKLNINRKIGGGSNNIIDTNCNQSVKYSFLMESGLNQNESDSFISFYLNTGNYTISKKLSIDNISFEYYQNDFLANRLCKTKQTFIAEAYSKLDTNQCEVTCETCFTKLGTKQTFVESSCMEFLSQGGGALSLKDTVSFENIYDTRKKDCEELCQKPKNTCDIKLEILQKDMEPGGQYAKYDYNTTTDLFSANVVTSGTNFNVLLNPNISNSSNALVYTYKNHPYFTQHGIMENGILVKSYSNFSVDEIIKNWQDTFTKVLVTQHPEYCKYMSCIENNTDDDFMRDFMATESDSEANVKGYFNLVGSPITDPYFKTGKAGNYLIDNFRDRLNNYVVYNDGNGDKGVSIFDVAIIQMYCNDEVNSTDLLDCINMHRDSVNNCTDNKNYYWYTYKSLYNALRQKISDSLVKVTNYNGSLCNDFRVGGNYTIRFPENTLKDTVGGNTSDSSAMKTALRPRIEVECLKTCQSYIPSWSNSLKNCNLNIADSTQVMTDLVSVCIIECNENNSFGASNISAAKQTTPNRYYSFNDVLKGIKHNPTGTGTNHYIKGVCDDVLITMPRPLGHDYLAYDSPYADTCSCNSSLYNYTGTNCTDTVSTTNPKCNDCQNTNNTLNEKVKLLFAQLRQSEDKYKCKNCIDCEAFKLANAQFIYKYYNFKDSTTAATRNIYTNFLNNTLKFNLSFTEYVEFGANCADTTNSFKAVLAKMIFYANSSLATAGSGSGYLPTGTNWNNANSIDTCGCNIILKAEKDFANGLIDTNLYATPKAYIEQVFNCGITLLDYDKFNYQCITVMNGLCSNDTAYLNRVKKDSLYNSVGNNPNWSTNRYCSIGGVKKIKSRNNNCAPPCVWLYDTINGAIVPYHWEDAPNYSAAFILHELGYNGSRDDLTNLNSCKPQKCCLKLCNKPFYELEFKAEDPCKVRIKAIALMAAENAYKLYVENKLAEFKTAYYKKCLRPLHIEKFDERFKQPQYQYTLYYYDQAGNLVKTVPPKGVMPLKNADAKMVDSYRLANATTILTPSHQMATLYKYNTLQNLIWQKTPDAGESYFHYDRLGRLVVSRNAKQANAIGVFQYSYTKFDKLSRIIEVGQIAKSNPITTEILNNDDDFANWLTETNISQITRTYYDEANYNIVDTILFKPKNLRSRVVYTTYSTNNNGTSIYDHAVHYTYDIHGNVKQVLREVRALKTLLQDYKIIEYDYDLVSGKVNNVYYQKGQADQYMHHYEYDAENRLVAAQSGPTNNQLDEDAAYYYYMHGPLARVELGQLKVQGVDYAYTLQGWLKGVNSSHINSYKDLGRDGYNGTNGYKGNSYVPIDEYGFNLNYFEGDYSPVGSNISTSNNFVASTSNSSLNSQALNLYNGNIRMMAVAIRQFGYSPLANAYRYDQLNRLVESSTFTNYDSTNNVFSSSGSAISAYKNTFAYDENGNILKQLRNGNTTQTNLDSLGYEYYSNGAEPTNKLKRVRDNVTTNNYTDDIDDQGEDNYAYDEIGNLIKDNAEQIASIEWTVYGKIRKITRITNSTKPDLEFEYTPDGHRVVKIVKPKDLSMSIYTYYVRDAQGNIMATYTRNFSKTIDYANITYTQINEKVVEKAGINAFANFTATNSNNAGLKGYLLGQLNTQEALLRSFSPYYLLTNNTTAFNNMLAQLTNEQFINVLFNNPDVNALCNCFTERNNNNNAELNLKEALFKTNTGIQLILENIEPSTIITVANSLGFGGGSVQDAIDFIKNYLLDTNIDENERDNRYNSFYNFLNSYIDLNNCSTNFLQILITAYNNNQAQFKKALAAISGIRDMFYNSASFTCNLRKTKAEAVSLFSNNHATLTWDALLQVQNTTYWLEWLHINDPDFLYKASYYSPSNVSTYQTNNNLYGGAYGGKQNYFVLLRNGLSQSTYDQILTYFLVQSSVYIDSMNLSEWHIYGSSRIGIYQTSINMAYRNIRIVNSVTTQETTATVSMPSYTLFSVERGAKRYELTNHLGNVLVVVSDKKIQVCSTNVVSYYIADVVSANDYSPFGAPLAGRSYSAPNSSYRFTFNGKEIDNETKTQDYGFRIYNTNLGRFLSVDPLTKFYPSWTAYHFAENRPVKAIDFDGLEAWDGPNDLKDVMSLHSYQKFTKTIINTIDEKTIKKYQFDCADFAYYFLIRYFEYEKVNLKFKVNNIEINSGNIKYKDFDDFFEKTRLIFGANYVNSKLTYKINKSEASYGDLITTVSHIEVNTPQGTETNGQVTISYGSGQYHGKNNPNNDVKTVINSGPGRLTGGNWGRWIMLKDAPNVNTPAYLIPRPLSAIQLVIPEVKSPEPPLKN